MKRCVKCRQDKPLAEFRRSNFSRDGLQSYCYLCQAYASSKAGKLEVLANRQRKAELQAQGLKVCADCGEAKEVTKYSKNKTSSDGLCSYCTECFGRHQREWRASHPDLVAASWDRFNSKHAERRREEHRQWARNHAEQVRQYRINRMERDPSWGKRVYETKLQWHKEYYRKNRQQLLAKQREYVRRNPLGSAIRARRHDALKQQAEGTFTQPQWDALCDWFGNVCLACGSEERLTIDHVVPLSKGGSNNIDNLQPLCHSCNSGKCARAVDYRDPDKLAKFLETLGK